MGPKREEKCNECHFNNNFPGDDCMDCNGHQVKVDHRSVSPIVQLISQSKGAQSFYACLASFFILLISFKCFLIIFSPEEREDFITFFGGQFGPIGYFVQLFIVHHLILYLLVYPIGKYYKHNTFVLTVTTLLSIILCKFAIYFVVINRQDTSATIRGACAFENVRVMMMIISFIIEAHQLHKRNAEPNEICLWKFSYFLFAPTLMYRSCYRRTNKPINWKAFTCFTIEWVAMFFITGLYIKDLLLPVAQKHIEMLKGDTNEIASYIRVFPFHATQALLSFFCIAFGFLHSYCNAMAELLCFADRNFYFDWWVNENGAELLRKWNRIVGSWLLEYVHKNLINLQIHRYLAMTMTLALSGLYHDYIIGIATGKWTIGFTLMMSGSVSMLIISPQLKKWSVLFHDILECTFGLISLGLIAMVHFYSSKTVKGDLYNSLQAEKSI